MRKNVISAKIVLSINVLIIGLLLFPPTLTFAQQPPVITISSPSNGTSFSTDSQMLITASATNTHSLGAYIDGKLVDRSDNWDNGVLRIGGYTLCNSGLAPGRHTLKITAFNGITATKYVSFFLSPGSKECNGKPSKPSAPPDRYSKLQYVYTQVMKVGPTVKYRKVYTDTRTGGFVNGPWEY